jgi:hypothetical protein
VVCSQRQAQESGEAIKTDMPPSLVKKTRIATNHNYSTADCPGPHPIILQLEWSISPDYLALLLLLLLFLKEE